MIKLKDIKKDQVFYECEYGENIKHTALHDVMESKNKAGDTIKRVED